MEKWQLSQRKSLPLEVKIQLSMNRIQEWYEHWDGNVYVAFSGGKDSTVLLKLVRSIYPNIPAVFSDTGLEYPEIRNFVKSIDNVTVVKPRKKFKDVIETYGYPVISKKNARYLRDLQNPTNKNGAVRNLRLTGYNRKGIYCPSMILPKKYRYLVDAPFKISERCCDYIKKEPLHKYSKETNSYPFIGILTGESSMREREYLKHGCNSYNLAEPTSQPIAFWTEQDILTYIMNENINIASIYGEIKRNKSGELYCSGESRTGCMFCMFGVHLEPSPNRFQRMKITHPAQYKYCMENLGIRKVLEYINVPYE